MPRHYTEYLIKAEKEAHDWWNKLNDDDRSYYADNMSSPITKKWDENMDTFESSKIVSQHKDFLDKNKENKSNTSKPISSDRWFTSAEKKTPLFKVAASLSEKGPCNPGVNLGKGCKKDNPNDPFIGGKKSRRKTRRSKKSHRKSSKKSHRKSRRGGKSRRGRR